MNRETVEVDQAAGGHLEALRFNGVDYLFGSPGSDDAPYWHALDEREPEESRPTYVQCRHEQLAVDMARGYAMHTGRPQAVKLHATVGPLNAALSLWGAYQHGTPLVVISSYVRRHEGAKAGGRYDLDFHQPGGHENNFERYLKWCASVETNETAPHYFARAFQLARSPPTGPVLMNVPKELPAEPVDSFEVVSLNSADPPVPAPSAIDDIAARLDAAENPLALTAGLGGDPDSTQALVSIAERLGMPVFEVPKLRHGFPMDHPLYLGNSAYGVYHTPEAYLQGEVDLVFVIGSPLPWYPPLGAAPDCPVVMLGAELTQPKRAYWNYPADVLAEGDTTAGLRALEAELGDGPAADPGRWQVEHERWQTRFEERALAGEREAPVDPFWLSHQLDDALPDDAVVVNETIDHGSAVSNLVADGRDRRFLSPERANAGGLGSGIGLALGSKLARPDRLVTLLVGDGTLNYSPMAAGFGAMAEHDLPVLVIVFNNQGYQVMRAAFLGGYPDRFEVTERYGTPIRPTPDYAAQAEAAGAYGERVDSGTEVEAAINRALEAVEDEGRPALLDVVLPDEPITDHPTVG